MSARVYNGDYCGCCGGRCKGVFCLACREHVLPISNRHAWERTWFAQHGADCPRQTPRFDPQAARDAAANNAYPNNRGGRDK